MLSNRNHYRAQARAQVAPRNRGQFTNYQVPNPQDDNAKYWQEMAARCKERLPKDLPWSDLTTHLWADDYTPTWRETANAMTLATQYWNAGTRDPEALAKRISTHATRQD